MKEYEVFNTLTDILKGWALAARCCTWLQYTEKVYVRKLYRLTCAKVSGYRKRKSTWFSKCSLRVFKGFSESDLKTFPKKNGHCCHISKFYTIKNRVEWLQRGKFDNKILYTH